MKQILTIAIYFALGANAVTAGTASPLVADEADEGDDVADADGTTRRVCPVAIPIPADAFDCQCFTTPAHIPRCIAITPDTCEQMIVSAFASGFLTLEAVLYLESAGYCPITVSSFPGVFDFCPRSR
jgi:hypothetical protein